MGEGRTGRITLYASAVAALAFGYGAGVRARPYDPPPVRPAGPVERFFTPPPVPVPATAVARAESLVQSQVRRESFPGAVLVIGNRELVQATEAYGRIRWDTAAPAPRADSTRYDLASLTKVVATTAAAMALVEDGRLDLDAPVQRYLPEFAGKGKDEVTFRHLLTHTAGLRAGAADIVSDDSAAVRRYLFRTSLIAEPGKDVLYSDLGFVVLWSALERAAGEPLPAFLRRRVWGPLGMNSTGIGVPSGCGNCAPTLYLEDRDEPYSGGSYDEVARRLYGVGGNAGAFSTAHDLARFAAMIANEGRLGDVRVFRPRTIRGFTRPQPGAGTRALGWEVYCREGIVPDHETCGEVYGFGHTGVTGTSLWIEPESRTWVILLTNRTYLPHREIDMQAFRRRVFEAVIADSARS